MFRSKLEYLQEQNSLLRRQNAFLQNLTQPTSHQNQRSLLFQLQQENDQLGVKAQKLSDELILQKSARQIQRKLYEENVEELNQAIFALKQQIKELESLIKEEEKVQHQLGPVEKWFRGKLSSEKQELFHTYAEPLLLFNILEELLESQEGEQESSQQATREGERIQNSQMGLQQERQQQDGKPKWLRWFYQDSEIYFLRKKRKENLRLQLKQAKLVQFAENAAKFKDKHMQPLGNAKLLKESYVGLIADYQKQRKRLVLYQKYIEELENRNKLLIDSLTTSS